MWRLRRIVLHIRTDGNGKIGTGHVMRCLEIAKAYKESRGTVQFLVADEESKNFIESKGFSCYMMNSKWNNLDSELDKLVTCKQECGVERLLIDSYFISKEYVKTWKNMGVKVAYLDDLCSEGYDLDALFNGAVWATQEKYEKWYQAGNTKLYLGCRYLPLRREFAKIPEKKVKEKADNILVLSGGTDPYHFLLGFATNLPEDMEKKCQYYLVCGIFNDDYEKIVSSCQGRENIHILHNVNNLYEYMCKADVAISACGMTLYELCACKTPSIMYLMADNQKGNMEGFIQGDLFESIGDIRESIDYAFLFEKLDSLMMDDVKRHNIAMKIKEMVDGKGAYRIADELGKL